MIHKDKVYTVKYLMLKGSKVKKEEKSCKTVKTVSMFQISLSRKKRCGYSRHPRSLYYKADMDALNLKLEGKSINLILKPVFLPFQGDNMHQLDKDAISLYHIIS